MGGGLMPAGTEPRSANSARGLPYIAPSPDTGGANWYRLLPATAGRS